MTSETKTEQGGEQRDRKLGDEWTDWNGDPGSSDPEIDETASTFFVLASVVVAGFVACVLLGWFLIEPRVGQLHPVLADAIRWIVRGFTALFLFSVIIESIALIKFRRSFFPYPWIEKFLISLLPGTIWLGSKLGIGKDRVGNSFIKVHNLITTRFITGSRAEKLLVLLPRCLKKEARAQLINKLNNRKDYQVFTVAGGEEARNAIRRYRPTSILAVACERDLMSGIKDVAEKIPVLAVPNKRPEGPCKNTELSLPELEEVLQVLRADKGVA